MNDRVFNFGAIGGSGYALVLLDCLESFIEKGQVRLVAMAVLPKEQGGAAILRAKARGTQIFDNWEEMLEAMQGKLDICLIPTGIAQHRPMATRALELGHRVFLEKPLAGCFEDALAIARAAQKHGDRLSVGYQDVYQPSVYRLRDLLRSGRIGQVRSIRGYGLWRRDAAYYNRNGWAGRMRVGEDWVLDSPLNNALAHYLNLMLFLASPHDNAVTTFSSIDAELYRTRQIENFDTGSVRIHTESGFPVEFHVTHSCLQHTGPFVRIEGDKGVALLRAFNGVEVITPEGTETFELEDSLGMRVNMFRSLLDWIAGRESKRCTAVQGLGQSLCVSMLHLLGPVQRVPERFLDPAAEAGAPAISGIEEIFIRCVEQGGLPSENGAPWGSGVQSIPTPPQWAEELEQVSGVGTVSG